MDNTNYYMSQPSNPIYNYTSQMNTNVYRVTSLEEAIMRTTARPSDMVYFNQDKDEFYRVKVDIEGKKCWATFMFTAPKPIQAVPIERGEFDEIKERLRAIEDKLLIKSEGNSDGKLNGQTI